MTIKEGGVYNGKVVEFVHDAQICAQNFWNNVDH